MSLWRFLEPDSGGYLGFSLPIQLEGVSLEATWWYKAIIRLMEIKVIAEDRQSVWQGMAQRERGVGDLAGSNNIPASHRASIYLDDITFNKVYYIRSRKDIRYEMGPH